MLKRVPGAACHEVCISKHQVDRHQRKRGNHHRDLDYG